MIETKLMEGELLEEFNRMFARWGGLVGKEKQAYNQLKEIVKEHFRRKDFTKGYEIKQIQQKPAVTAEEVFHFHQNLMTISDDSKTAEECHAREIDYIHYWLRENDMEVVEITDK